MAPSVYVTRDLPEPALPLLRAQCQTVGLNPHDRALTRQELLAAVPGRDGILCTGMDPMDDEVLDAAGPSLRAIAVCAVGYDNISVPELTRRGIGASNTPDVLTETTADLAWALMMAAARRVAEGDRFVRAGLWKGWGPRQMLGLDLHGKTLGVVGAGRIGCAVARRARGFDMQVLYHNRRPRPELERDLGAVRVPLDELLRRSDFVSINLPLTFQTVHAIGARELALMKPTAVLVNTGRGPLVDEAALADALRAGRIAAAGLDVFEEEPRVRPELLALENVVLTPHVGSGTLETRSKMAELAARCLLSMLKGEAPEQCLNPEVFGKAVPGSQFSVPG
jgi:glyoxylate reductase